MRFSAACLLTALAVSAAQPARAQDEKLILPPSVQAGSAFSVQTTGSGQAVLYIVGPGQALKREIQRGGTTTFAAGSLYNAGHYVVFVAEVPGKSPSASGAFTASGSLDVVPADQPATLSFLAKPSRLPVGVHDGISGTVYIFDAWRNLITTPAAVSFALSNPAAPLQQRTVPAQNGAAWTVMNSTAREGVDTFRAQVGGISSTRVVEQVPGDPCSLKMSAQQSGQRLELKTDPVRDCGGNAVPDGTIVTFTEDYGGTQSTVDVPLKRGIAQVEMPAYKGAKISVASGVVLGNEIHWQ